MTRFTPEEIDLLRWCVAEGMTVRQAVHHFENRRDDTLRRKAGDMGLTFAMERRGPAHQMVRPIEPNLPRVPPRSTASLTAFVCGDPAPGRSALDQRAGR